MVIKIFLYYILGYVHIKIEGFFVERVINKAINSNIFFWNMKRTKSTILYTNVGLKQYKELVDIASQNQCQITMLSQRGLPFVFSRYKKRKIFLIVIILIIALLFTLSKFIWNIKIEGLNKIDKQEMLNILEKEGIQVGILKSKVNQEKTINKIRLEREDIAWIGIQLEGTNAIIKVVEITQKPEIINEEDYCNIVSDKYAQIIKISAQNRYSRSKRRRHCNKRSNSNCWLDGRQIYRDTIYACYRRDSGQSLVHRKEKN